MKYNNTLCGEGKRFKLLLFLFSFAFYCLVMWCAPYSSDDLEFGTLPFTTFREYLQYVLEYGNGRFLGNFCAIWLTNSRVMCVLVKAFGMASTTLLLPAVLGFTSVCDYLLSFLLVTAIDPALFGEVYAWTSGFSNYMPPVWMSLVIVWLIQRSGGRNTPANIVAGMAVAVLGVASQLFIEHSSGVNVLLALCAVVVYARRREKAGSVLSAIWLAATAVGLGIMLMGPKLFHIEDNHTDIYRSVHLNSIAALVVSCAKNVIQLSNHHFGPCTLPMCFGAFATVYMTRNSRSEKGNRALYLAAGSTLIYLLLSLTLALDGYLGKSAIVQHVISGAFAFVPYVVWVIAALRLEGDLRIKMLGLLAFAFVSLAPLLVVTPIPTRVVFQAHVFIMLGAMVCFAQIRRDFPEGWLRPITRTAAAVCLTLVVLLSSVFISIRFMADIREAHIRRELDAGAEEIAIFSLPYTYATWDHLWAQKFYNTTGRDVTFNRIEFDTWMSDVYR